MFGTIMAIGILVLLIIYFVQKNKTKDKSPLVEISTDEHIVQNLGLKPGESVTLRNSDKFEEVHVFGGPDGESRLGTLTQKFIYKKVGNNSVRARIHSIKGDRLRLELNKA